MYSIQRIAGPAVKRDAYAIKGASRMPVEKLRREVLRALEREDADRAAKGDAA